MHKHQFDAVSVIAKSIHQVLVDYLECYNRGHFMCEHPDIPFVKAAVDYFKSDDFDDIDYLVRVGSLLPYLWD